MSTDNMHGDPYAYNGGLTYVKVVEDDVDDVVEMPTEPDNTILLTTLQGQFPNALGLRFKAPSGAWRAVRLTELAMDPPPGGWGDITYFITFQKESGKRKILESTMDEPEAKSSRQENETKVPKVSEKHLLQDMIVMSLPFKCTDNDLKEYFTKTCGEMTLHQVKFDHVTKKPRGFGFIRFKTVEASKNALVGEHCIMGRHCEVRLSKKKEEPLKLFIGRIPEGTTADKLREHFQQFGEIYDSYIPQPFKNFGFITFTNAEDGRAVLRREHKMGDRHLNVQHTATKEEKMVQKGAMQFDEPRRVNMPGMYDEQRRGNMPGILGRPGMFDESRRGNMPGILGMPGRPGMFDESRRGNMPGILGMPGGPGMFDESRRANMPGILGNSPGMSGYYTPDYKNAQLEETKTNAPVSSSGGGSGYYTPDYLRGQPNHPKNPKDMNDSEFKNMLFSILNRR